MRLDKDDPRLMDYVLGELEDGEALDVAAALADDENQEARALVDELRGVADTTRRILREDSEEERLTDAQRAEIVGQVGDGPISFAAHKNSKVTFIQFLSAAAVLAILAGLTSIAVPNYGGSSKRVYTLGDEITAYAPGDDAPPEMNDYSRSSSAPAISLSRSALTTNASPASPTIEPEALESLSPEQLRVARQQEAQNNLQGVELDGSIRIRGNYYDSDDDIFINGGEDHAWYESRTRVGIGMEVPEESLQTRGAYNDDTDHSFTSGLDFAGGAQAGQEVDLYQSYTEIHGAKSSNTTGSPGDKSVELLDQQTDIVEARNRLELKASLKEGFSLSYDSDKDGAKAQPEPKRQEAEWAEYNVGNLTGQTELPDRLASNQDWTDIDNDSDGMKDWQWNAPNDKPTEIVGGPGSETYVKVAAVKPFVAVREEPLSTFSIDVDTAAYSNVRRFLSQGQLPPPDAVRVEEMINYFDYAYPQPVDGRPFAVAVMGAPAPWDPAHRLVRIGVKGKEVPQSERPPANLVFLLDVSGSMSDANKLPLVKESMKTLLAQLRPNDRVAIVTYAGNASKVLDPTPCSERGAITAAIDSLRANGGTNGGGGIQMAYDLAQASFIQGGVNRVLIATDGDFNVGVTSHGDLMSMIEARAKSGVFLTALGFGMGNLKDSTLEQLADRGNGNYAYIDNHAEARRALVDQLSGTLQTIAKDVKIQVEFNPTLVSHYRLLGYENRALAAQDFNDDTKDAGEIGAGHTVTALYEIIPVGGAPAPGVDPLKYQSTSPGVDPLRYGNEGAPAEEDSIAPGPEPMPRPEPPAFQEWLTVKMRYKQPEGNESTKLEVPLTAMNSDLRETDPDFRFASAVAAFGQVLRHSGYRHASNFDRIIEMARASANNNPDREAFVDMVITAKTLCGPR